MSKLGIRKVFLNMEVSIKLKIKKIEYNLISTKTWLTPINRGLSFVLTLNHFQNTSVSGNFMTFHNNE